MSWERTIKTVSNGRIFWIVFIIIWVLLMVGISQRIIIFDLLLGLIIIILGLAKLSDDLRKKEFIDITTKTSKNLEQINDYLTTHYDFNKKINDKHNYRFFQLNKKRLKTEKKIEKNYRELAKKILDLENKLNDIKKLVVKKEKVRKSKRK